MRHLVSLFDYTAGEIQEIFNIARQIKTQYREQQREPLLLGRVMALLFEKPSLRTRVSFESAMAQLGGSSLFLGADVGWGTRESIEDFSRVLSEYVDVIVCRANAHQRVVELAEHARVPVINGLTDLAHPCQALADLFSLEEVFGQLSGQRIAYIGDSNNVARSLAIACGLLGIEFAVASPPGYEFPAEFVTQLRREIPEACLTQTNDPREAADQACCVYTDVWTSMGQEAERVRREADFADFQVTPQLMAAALPEARFMHCLPARRGEEVAAEVIDGPQSLVIQQAGNRMHLQKGVLVYLISSECSL